MGNMISNGKITYDFMYTPRNENIKLALVEFDTKVERSEIVDMQDIIPNKYDGGVVYFRMFEQMKLW